ncbi:MAG: alpha-galactosidase [Clostridia bacterium]|nr:alpha-galactosidase [Clostridia bacterium]
MSITFDPKKQSFILETRETSYQMMVDEKGYLLHLHYGAKVDGLSDHLLTFKDHGFSVNPYSAGEDRTYTLDALPQEFPFQGSGDFRSPAFMVKDATGTIGCDLHYAGYTIETGKYALPGLPAVYALDSDEDVQTLTIELKEERLGLSVKLLYGVLPEKDIITRSAIVEHCGDAPVSVEKFQTAVLDFQYGTYDLLVFHGQHGYERQLQRTKVGHTRQAVGSTRGYSSHQYNPFVILAEQSTSEGAGRCWSMQFVYSGSFLAEAEKDQFSQTRLQMGLTEEGLSYELLPGERLVAPEVILSFSGSGFGKLSRNHHRVIRENVCRGVWKDRPRPVLINSWEAFLFDFDGDRLLNFAEEARDLGIDMMVLDDGWFGSRDDDNQALGDWFVNEEKLGGTLGELSAAIHNLPMKFGLWVEPEMVSENSRLYEAHPDWALSIPGKKPTRGRNQLVLDYSRKEVVDSIFDAICKVLDSAEVDYLKWDANRSISDIHSETTLPGKLLYDYMLGLYDFLERLTQRYPNMLIEGCSGGGGRFDAGMLYYTPQIWCSDNTDAVDRLYIQYGTSFGYPTSAVGAHVSVCPNQQNGKITPFETRATVAMAGTFGYELDPSELTEEEKAAVREQIARFKQYATLIQQGDYYRLSSPFTDKVTAWAIHARDRSESLVSVVYFPIRGIAGNAPTRYLRVGGLDPDALYVVGDTGLTLSGSMLGEVGFPLPVPQFDYQSLQYYLKRV